MRRRSTQRPPRPLRSRHALNSKHYRPQLEPLEIRQLLTAINWSSSTSGSWDVASNWSTDTVPGSGDDVTIDKPGVTVTISSNAKSVHSITADDPLVISGGGLAVAANSTISDGLAMTGGALSASGSGITMTVTGPTMISGASLYAENAATLSLSKLTSYAGGVGYTDTLQATGSKSTLSLPMLASITGATTNGNSWTQVQAMAGGDVELPALTQVTGGPVLLEGDGSGSKLDVSSLTSFEGISGCCWNNFATLQASNSGTVLDGSLTSLGDVNLPLDNTASLAIARITSYTGGTLSFGAGTLTMPVLADGDGSVFKISGGVTVTLPALTKADGASFLVSGGAALSLPALASYAGGVGYTDTLQATGSKSTLSLPMLASITGATTNGNSWTQVQAMAGGDVELPALTQVTGGPVLLEGDGSGSKLDVSSLTSFEGISGCCWNNFATLQASNSGTVLDGSLTSLGDVNLPLDNTASLAIAQVTSYTGGTLSFGAGTLTMPVLADGDGSVFKISGGVTVTLPALTKADGASFLVSGGAALSLPALASYAGGVGYTDTLQATGSKSTLSLPMLASITGATTNGNSWTQVQAMAGGDVELPALTQVTGGPVLLEGDGSGSKLDVSSLTSFEGISGCCWNNFATLQASNSGTVLDGSLTSLGDVNLPLDNTASLAIARITSYTGGTLSFGADTLTMPVLADGDGSVFKISGGVTVTLPALTKADGASFLVSGGAALSLPALASYAGGVGYTDTLQATGSKSTLSLPMLASITGATTNGNSWTQVQALAGGDEELPALTQVSGGPVLLEGDGSGSKLDVSSLTSFEGISGCCWNNFATLQASNSGTVLDGSLTSLSDVNLPLDNTASLAIAQITSYTGGTLSFGAGTLSMPLLADGDGSVFKISGGVTVTLPAMTKADGASFLVSGGAALSLPALASYAGGVGYTDTLQATGSKSTLSLPMLASITGATTNGNSWTQVQALAGGDEELPALTQVSGGPVLLEGDGSGSKLDVSSLTSFEGITGCCWNNFATLEISDGGTVLDPDLSQINGVSLVGDSTGTFTIPPTLGFTISGGTSTVQAGTLVDQGILSVQTGATLDIEGALTVNGSGILTSVPGSTIEVSGKLLGTTQNAADFNPLGTVELDSGTGTSNPPQELEAMSDDLGAVQAGFANNFAYGTISLTSDTSVELVDLSHNTSSTSPEAVYANELIVPSGATLNLNNLHFYVRGDQVSGTIVGGTVTIVPSGGSIALNTPTPGTLTPAGAVEDWAFYGTTGESLTVELNPGGGGSEPALAPQLGWGQVELLDPNNDVLASATSSSNGAVATISGFSLPANQTYTIQVQAPAAEVSSTGNYVLSAYNVTPNVYPLTVNQSSTGTIHSGYGVDQWTFTGAAGEQVELNVISTSSGAVAFDLTGPGGYTAFTNQESDSGPITLPSSGNYILSAQGTGGQRGSYAFELEQTSVTNLTLGTPYNGSLAGSGQAQLFEVSLPATQALVVTLQDSSADVNQLYASLGSPPTLGNYGYSSSNGVTASPQLLVPSAAPGDWYILVYSVSVPAASTFTLSAAGVPITLTTVAPAQSAAGSSATLTLSGSGFNNSTSVELVSMGNTVYKAGSVTLDTFTRLTATFDISGVPQGVYSVVVNSPGGQSSELAGSFTVTAPGTAHLVTHLILPSQMGRHISSTIYIEYANTGSVAMPAPLLVLVAPPEVIDGQTITNLPLFTLNPALVVSGYWTSALPEGYSNSVEILASGKEVPGWLEPGESETVPVYYAGMQQPWSFAESSFQFKLDVYTEQDPTALDWSSLKGSLKPPGISTMAWNAIAASLATQVGGTWGDYVAMLDNEVSYLGQLGEDVTDVSELWSFALMQADGLTPTPELAGATDIDVAVPGPVSLDFSRVYQEPLSSRDAIGPLGYGWSDDWQYSLSVASDGTVTVIMPGGEQRVFQPDSRGSDYFDQPGDNGVLTKSAGGAFTLQEADGEIEQFNANGTLDYLQDTNGNRITAGYTGSQLTSLTDTSGASLTIAYNAQGLIASVTSPDGQTVKYNYDPGEHLISVQSYDGEVTQYTYESGSDESTENALTSITNPDGTSQNFTYSLSGQLTGTSQAGGADPLTYSYNSGEVTVTDAAGDASQYYFDENGDLVKTADALGNVTFATYDSNGNLTSLTDSTGLTTTYTYNSNGNLVSSTDALGQTTSYTYSSSDNLLASVTNAQGDTTNYNYNASGDLTSTEYPDDTVETATYDALGDPLSLTDQDGEVTNYTYNAAGQVASETLAGGSTMTYTYDAQGNLITATDSTGATTLTYNSADELTSIAYPTGLSLQYTYNAGGQRTQMVEMSASTITYTVNYSHNSLGQLVQLTDGTARTSYDTHTTTSAN